MSAARYVAGVDPGPTTGLALLDLSATRPGDGARVFQCNAAAAGWLLGTLLGEYAPAGIRVAAEPFVAGAGAGARAKPGRATREQVETVRDICAEHGVPVITRNAGTVKPWAEGNDCRRLRVSGLLALVPGMPHAKSALGQALHCAVWCCDYPDPLSRKARA